MFCSRHVFEPRAGTIWIRRWFKWHPLAVVCWKICFNFIWISLLDFKFSTQFISITLVSALTIFQVSWIIFIDWTTLYLLSLLVILWWQNDWLTDCATCLRSELHYLQRGHSSSRSLLFLCLISFLIHTYIHKCILCITFETYLKFPAHR